MKQLNLENVTAREAGGGFTQLEPGGYICRIVNVTDVPEKEYLRVDIDIASGEYKDYFRELCESTGYWLSTVYWSYKDKNLPYFKSSIETVEKSNPGYRFSDANEQELRGKVIGAVFAEEEYRSRAGELRISVKPRFVCTAQRIMDNDYTVPAKKEYRERPSAAYTSARYSDPASSVTPMGKDDLDDWAKGQKLPWE